MPWSKSIVLGIYYQWKQVLCWQIHVCNEKWTEQRATMFDDIRQYRSDLQLPQRLRCNLLFIISWFTHRYVSYINLLTLFRSFQIKVDKLIGFNNRINLNLTLSIADENETYIAIENGRCDEKNWIACSLSSRFYASLNRFSAISFNFSATNQTNWNKMKNSLWIRNDFWMFFFQTYTIHGFGMSNALSND